MFSILPWYISRYTSLIDCFQLEVGFFFLFFVFFSPPFISMERFVARFRTEPVSCTWIKKVRCDETVETTYLAGEASPLSTYAFHLGE